MKDKKKVTAQKNPRPTEGSGKGTTFMINLGPTAEKKIIHLVMALAKKILGDKDEETESVLPAEFSEIQEEKKDISSAQSLPTDQQEEEIKEQLEEIEDEENGLKVNNYYQIRKHLVRTEIFKKTTGEKLINTFDGNEELKTQGYWPLHSEKRNYTHKVLNHRGRCISFSVSRGNEKNWVEENFTLAGDYRRDLYRNKRLTHALQIFRNGGVTETVYLESGEVRESTLSTGTFFTVNVYDKDGMMLSSRPNVKKDSIPQTIPLRFQKRIEKVFGTALLNKVLAGKKPPVKVQKRMGFDAIMEKRKMEENQNSRD